MAGSGYIIGGLLGGLGRGMEQDVLYDRQLALENLRNQRQIEGEDRAEQRDDRKAERDYGYDVKKLGTAAEVREKQSQSDYARDVDMFNRKSSFEERQTRVQADLQLRNSRSLAQFNKDMESGDVEDIVIDKSGNYVGLLKNGTTRSYGVAAKPEGPTTAELEAQQLETADKKRLARELKKKNLGEAKPGQRPQPGMTYNGRMYIGGDPRDKSNWIIM